MRKIFFTGSVILLVLLNSSCHHDTIKSKDKAKKEIAQAERDFEKMAAEKGIAQAFGYFADTNAVIKTANDSLIRGKEGIRNFFTTDNFKNAAVKWSPDFIDAALSGDMGYTYGKYTWQSKDSTGKLTESNGIFHTVWKKQKDGSWKFVWD